MKRIASHRQRAYGRLADDPRACADASTTRAENQHSTPLSRYASRSVREISFIGRSRAARCRAAPLAFQPDFRYNQGAEIDPHS